MSRIFLSHSSHNDAEAKAIHAWLRSEGWDDIFLDLDPERGIKAGERWQNALRRASSVCELVIFLITPEWAASNWCRTEFLVAKQLNKRIFGVLVAPTPLDALPVEMTVEWQVVDLTQNGANIGFEHRGLRFSKEGLDRLKLGLLNAGLDPKYFEWPPVDDPQRSPYRGLAPMEAEDAGVFFGREGPIVDATDQIRGLAEAAHPKFFTILGASGAGKSSFMRAGLLPRLSRENSRYRVLPVIRPGTKSISGETGFSAALAKALAITGHLRTRAEITKACGEMDTSFIRRLLSELLVGSDEGAQSLQLLLPVDQGEELFLTDGADEANLFQELLQDLVSQDDPAIIVMVTIRSDSFEALQSTPALQGIAQHTWSLPVMPTGAYGQVIRGPARRMSEGVRRLELEEPLVEALLEQIGARPAKDALPLLAFTLERLYRDYGGNGQISHDDFRDLGGIAGAIAAAADQAMDEARTVPGVPQAPDEREALLRRAIIPHLAAIDPDSGTPRRRVARLSQLPPEAGPLINLLVDQRLLTRDIEPETSETTIEPAHEALLRQWPLLDKWLEEDFEDLSLAEGVKRARRDWEANDRSAEWLVHKKGRLEWAMRVVDEPTYRSFFNGDDRRYLEEAESEERRRIEAEARRRTLRNFGIAASMVLTFAASWFYIATLQAQKNRTDESIQLTLASLAQSRASSNPDLGIRTALAVWPKSEPISENFADIVASAFSSALPQLRPSIRTTGHGGSIASIAFSQDGERFVSGGWDGYVRVWNTRSGELLGQHKEHNAMVTSVAIGGANNLIVSGSRDKTVRLWSYTTDEPTEIIGRHEELVSSVAISTDGRWILSGGFDDVLKLWGVDGTLMKEFEEPTDDVMSVAFSHDGELLASGGEDNTVRAWKITGELVFERKRIHERGVLSVAFSPKGSRIVSGSNDHTVRIWDISTGKELIRMEGHAGAVFSAAFRSDGNRVVSGGHDRTVRIWDAETGIEMQRLNGHQDQVTSVALSPDDHRIVSGSRDGELRIWDASVWTELNRAFSKGGTVLSVAVSPDGSRVVTGTSGGTLEIWDGLTGQSLETIEKAHARPVTTVAFNSGGTQIISGSQDGTIGLWETNTGKELNRLVDRQNQINSVAFHPQDDWRAMSGGNDEYIKVWDIKAETVIGRMKHDGSVTSMAFSPDGLLIASVGYDNTLRIWDAGTMKEIFRRDFPRAVTSVAFSANGKRIVTGSGDGIPRLWDAESGDELQSYVGHGDNVRTVAFSPDGNRVVSGSDDRSIRIWDMESGVELQRIRGHQGRIYSLTAYLPDNSDDSRIVSGSRDGTVRVWKLPSLDRNVLQKSCEFIPSMNGKRDFGVTGLASDIGIGDEYLNEINQCAHFEPPYPVVWKIAGSRDN